MNEKIFILFPLKYFSFLTKGVVGKEVTVNFIYFLSIRDDFEE